MRSERESRFSSSRKKADVVKPRPVRVGATRTQPKSGASSFKKIGRILWRLMLFSGLVGGVVALLVYIDPKEKIEQFAHRPIKEIQIEGSFQFLEMESLRTEVENYLQGSFLDLNLNDLKYELENKPWIDSVTIARIWPDKLIVRVVEQQPIAKWGNKGFLNMRGDIVEVEKATKIESLPLLKGDDRYAREIMGQYLRIGKLLTQYQMPLAAVELDDTRAWMLTLQSGMVIKLGRDRLWEKLQYLLMAKGGQLAGDFHKIQQVDMRYPSGFAVTWKSESADNYVAGN